MLSADRWHQGECVSVKMNLGLYDLLKSLALKGKCTRAGIKGLRNSEKDFCFYIPVSDTQLERKTSKEEEDFGVSEKMGISWKDSWLGNSELFPKPALWCHQGRFAYRILMVVFSLCPQYKTAVNTGECLPSC